MKLSETHLNQLVKEEIRRVFEGAMNPGYWVDPQGDRYKVPGLHIEWLEDNRHRFRSIPDDFDTSNIMDPDFAQRRFFPKGWINISVIDDFVVVRGTRRHIEEHLDSVLFSDSDKVYTFSLYDEQGQPVEELQNLSREEVVEEFDKYL